MAVGTGVEVADSACAVSVSNGIAGLEIAVGNEVGTDPVVGVLVGASGNAPWHPMAIIRAMGSASR